MRVRCAICGMCCARVWASRAPPVLATEKDGKPTLLAAGTPEAVEVGFDADAVIKAISGNIKGGGGGKAAMAQARRQRRLGHRRGPSGCARHAAVGLLAGRRAEGCGAQAGPELARNVHRTFPTRWVRRREAKRDKSPKGESRGAPLGTAPRRFFRWGHRLCERRFNLRGVFFGGFSVNRRSPFFSWGVIMLPRLPLRDARDRLVVFVNLGRAKRIEKSYSVVCGIDFGKNFEVCKSYIY